MVTKTLEDVFIDLCKYIHSDTIIIGHSLENDFKALKIIHDKILDTSLLFKPRNSRRKHKLKFLANRFLKRKIQTESSGHDSCEDALAALDLIKLKLQNGPAFGVEDSLCLCSIFTVLSEVAQKKSVLIAKTPIVQRVMCFAGIIGNPTFFFLKVSRFFCLLCVNEYAWK